MLRAINGTLKRINTSVSKISITVYCFLYVNAVCLIPECVVRGETSKSEQASYKTVSLTANTNKPHTQYTKY